MSGFLETGTGPRHRRLMLGGSAVLLVVIGWVWLSRKPATAALPSGGPLAVAVDTALATRRDVPVYLEGLGNVQAFYTAKITARVDGQLQRVGFVEGQLVKKGDLLAQIDPRPLQAALDQATGMQAKDAAQLDSAKRDLERYTTLAPQNLISQQVLDTQRALVAQLQAQLQVDRGLIDNARTQLEYASITAPFSGRTGIRLVDPGNIVHAADTTGIVVVTQIQPISVMFTLPEDVVLQINQALAMGAVAVTALLRDDQTQLDTGTLTLVDNEIDPTTGTVRLKATFPNVRNTLWPGQFVNVRVLMQSRHDVVTLPSAAVEHGPDGLFAYVVKADSTVEARPIKTAEDSGGVTVVTDGLQSGERVVTSNQYRLQPGAKVRPVAPAPSSATMQSGPPQDADSQASKVARGLAP
jgi:membrane fusion protein, multidrug efflux system